MADMRQRTLRRVAALLVAAVAIGAAAPAQAQGFFNFFGNFNRPAPRAVVMPFAAEGDGFGYEQRARPVAPVSRGQAFCVRTCDGRHFPISSGDSQSKATTCNNFCPASETRVYYGSTIDDAVSDKGKSYTGLPNAYKYRETLVAGCTCNGKDQIGLAPVKIENDPTLKRGDIVAGADGLMVNRGQDRRGASLNLSPASKSIRDTYERPPVVASE